MSAEQKTAAMALLMSGLSAMGAMLHRTDQHPTNSKCGDSQYGWYFVSVFGDPSATGKWGWRFEGHHLSVNYTLDKGEVVSATPLLFASNPAEVKAGGKKGLRALPDIEDHARALIKSLDEKQDKAARQGKEFAEIKEGQPKADVGNPVGIPAADLTAAQRETLQKLLAAYTTACPTTSPRASRNALGDTAGKLFFAYSSSPEPGSRTPIVYALEFVVEF